MRLGRCLKENSPFAGMVLLECLAVGMSVISKSAMNRGMSNLVFLVYYNSLGFLLFLPFFLPHFYRKRPPPITLWLLWRFFLLGLCGNSAILFTFIGVDYSSPTLSAALTNLSPIFTFLFGIIFRMEKIEVRSRSSIAKCLGTIITVSGAIAVTFYKGAPIFSTTSSPSIHNFDLSFHSNWIIGGLFLVIGQLSASLWYILQTLTVEEYPDQETVVFFYILFGTIQGAVLGVVMERNLSAWKLHLDMEMVAIVYTAVYGTLIRNIFVTWCLSKKGPLFVVMFQPLQIIFAMIGGFIFLADTLYMGSMVGSIIIVVGFYTVMSGQVMEKKMVEDALQIHQSHEASSSNTPLLFKYNRQEI